LKRFRSALQSSRFSRIAELPAATIDSLDGWLEQARALAVDADGIVIGEAPPGEACVASTALAALLLRDGIDPIPRLGCRDRNRIALHSELLGLRALGVTSLLLEHGDVQGLEGKPVFDMNRDELIATASSLNEDLPGAAEQDLLIGTTTTLAMDQDPLLQSASTAGARFLLIEPVDDLEQFADVMKRWVDHRITWQYSIVVTVADGEQAKHQEKALRAIPGVSGVNTRFN
jgi:methylenetetrahydrofolate reductase (NADPH)